MGGRLPLYGLVIVWAEPTSYTPRTPVPRSPCVLCRLFSSAACLFPFFHPFFALFLIIALSLSLFVLHHASHSFSWGSHCISEHVLNRIVYVLPTYRLGVFLVFPLLIFFLPLCLLLHPVPFFGLVACSDGAWKVLCLVLFLPRVALSCRVPS